MYGPELSRLLDKQGLRTRLYGENMVWPLSTKLGRWEVGAGAIDRLGDWEQAPHRQ